MGVSWIDCKSKKKKATSFWSVVFSYSTRQQWTISWSDSDMHPKVDFTQQPVMTSSMAGLRRSSKALPKAKLAPKKSHSHCLVVCCPYDTLQLSQSQHNPYIWDIRSAKQWEAPKTARPETSISQQKGSNYFPRQRPSACCTTNASKVEGIEL